MLILSRKPSETIRIGRDVSVTVLGVRGNQVRLGIEAPSNIGIYRGEIATRIEAEGGDPSMAGSRRRTSAATTP